MSIKSALVDIRKMKRSVQMREEADPEAVVNTLETILKESIALQATRGGVIERGAINELKQVRNALVAQQINAGSRSAEFVGKFSMVLDQLEEERRTQDHEVNSRTFGSITDNLPNLETITSAVITANPIVGYGMKILGDMARTRRASRAQAREETKKRLEMLKEREEAIEQQMENEEARANGTSEDHELLENIRDEIKALQQYLETSNQSLERMEQPVSQIGQATEETSTSLERLATTEEEETRLRKEGSSVENFNALEGQIEAQGSTEDTPNIISTDNDNSRLMMPMVGLMSAMGGVLSGAMGAIGGLAARLLAPFTRLFTFLKGSGRLLSTLGRGSGILTAVFSLYDFADGLINAEEILGREDVSLGDRIRVGASHVISGLLAPIDWVMEFFGGNLYDGSRDELTAKLANGMVELVDNIVTWSKEMFNEVMDWFKDSFNKIVEGIKQFGEDIEEKMRSWIPDWLQGENLEEEDTNPNSYGQGGAMQRRALQEQRERQERLKQEAETRPADRVSEGLEGEQGANTGGNTMINAPSNVNNVTQQTPGAEPRVPDSRSNESVFRRFNNRTSYMGWTY